MTADNQGKATQPRARTALSDLEKAALIVMSVGPDSAAKIFAGLEDDEAGQLTMAMAQLGHVPYELVESTLMSFVTQLASGLDVFGSPQETERLLSKHFDAQTVQQLMMEIRAPVGRNIWDKLSHVNPDVLAAYLAHEVPQTISFILSKLQPQFVADILTRLPQETAIECVERMLLLETPREDMQRDVEDTLRTEFVTNLASRLRPDAFADVAKIFNLMDRSSEKRILAALDRQAKDQAERIRSMMFVFEDLRVLDTAGIQTLLRGVDKSDLPLALKTASAELQALVFGSMSERGAKLLKEELSGTGPVRLRDVEQAQARIVATARQMAEEGQLMLGRGASEDALVY